MGHLEGNFTPVLYIDARFLKVNFLEPSGPAQACYGRTLLYFTLLYLHKRTVWQCTEILPVTAFGTCCDRLL